MPKSTIQLRTLILCEMNNYILNEIDDEEILPIWFSLGIPEGADIEDLIEIAKDSDLWFDCVRTFSKCCKMEVEVI